MKLPLYQPADFCSDCGGKCCKRMPGATFSSEFETENGFDWREVKKRLKSGLWAVDWWEGDVFDDPDGKAACYYLRPATKDEEGVLLDGSWGGECILLTNEGCSLSFNERPMECQALEPQVNFNCKSSDEASKEGAVKSWYDYSPQLRELAQNLLREKCIA